MKRIIIMFVLSFFVLASFSLITACGETADNDNNNESESETNESKGEDLVYSGREFHSVQLRSTKLFELPQLGMER